MERVSKGPNELTGNSSAERWGAKRPKADGPTRMPPMISPITRAWPTLSASQPQATVISNTIAIWVNNRVMGSDDPSPDRAVDGERLFQFIEL